MKQRKRQQDINQLAASIVADATQEQNANPSWRQIDAFFDSIHERVQNMHFPFLLKLNAGIIRLSECCLTPGGRPVQEVEQSGSAGRILRKQ